MTASNGHPGGRDIRLNTYDWTADAASSAVVETVAALTGREATALPPLYDSVDPDALDALFADVPAGGDPRVSFSYAGHHVTIDAAGTLVARPLP